MQFANNVLLCTQKVEENSVWKEVRIGDNEWGIFHYDDAK